MRFVDLPENPIPPEHTYQSLIEFGALWDYAAALIDPKHIVEIGSLYGGTLWFWLQQPNVESVVSIDVALSYAPLRAEILASRKLWAEWQRLYVINRRSDDPAVVDMLGDTPIDVLFIDGDHTYDGVRGDFERFSPLVRDGGLVAFHDTVVNGTRDEPGVRQFVAELKRRWRLLSVEFFDPDGAGITAFVL